METYSAMPRQITLKERLKIIHIPTNSLHWQLSLLWVVNLDFLEYEVVVSSVCRYHFGLADYQGCDQAIGFLT